jgi:hypothetical protein
MNSESLETWQAGTMRKSLQASLSYLHRLQRRMEKTGFPPDDPLFVRVRKAYGAMHAVCMELHAYSAKIRGAAPLSPRGKDFITAKRF